jgi:hypothetical protein
MTYFRNFQKLNLGDPKPEKKEKKKQKPIKKLSEKRAKENKVYLELRKIFLAEKPYCEVRLPGCTSLSSEIHHSEGRVGKLLCDTKHFVSICRNCHRNLHDK